MRMAKRVTAWALICFILITSGCSSVFATSVIAEDGTGAAEQSFSEDTEAADAEDAGWADENETEATETAETAETADSSLPEALVNYLYVQEPVVTTPGIQKIMLGIGDGSSSVESAVLTWRNQATGDVYETEAAELLDDFVLFQMEYKDESWNGAYQLETITYTVEGTEITTAFAEMGIDAAFGVNQTAESQPDDVFLSDEEVEALAAETEMSVVALDEEGRPASGETLEEALENAGCEPAADIASNPQGLMKGAGVDATGMRSIIVVLDAGHGGSDPGACANGIVEKTVNLKIAQYCQAELQEYAGVIVYMTRTTDTYLSLAQRAQVAIDKHADVFVSLHNNSNNSSAPNGANVYYPNSNYNASCGSVGSALATLIESKLTELGLASGGIHIRNSENGTRYPDGSLADYYGVIKRCKENGIPGLIVEHAFISNASDASKYLSSDEKLKQLGIADAAGIAEYFGLSKGLGFNSIETSGTTTMNLSWTPVSGVTGYRIERSRSQSAGFEEVAKITSASTTTWKDTGLEPGTTYYYRIRTYTKSGSKTKYSKYSPVQSGTTMEVLAISSIKSKNSKQLELSWSAVNNASTYELYRAAKKAGTYTKIATVIGSDKIKYVDKVTAGKLYYYKVRSVSVDNGITVYSEYSEALPARTAKVPSAVAVKSQASDTLRVSWKADSKASGYIIKRASSANGAYKKVGTVKGGEKTYYDDTSVKTNVTYYYKVQAYNHNQKTKGYSGYGSAASGKTIKKTAITKIVSNSTTKQTISWKKVSGVDGYVIYQSTSKDGKYKKIKTITSANKTSYKVTKLKAGTRYYYKIRTRKKVKGKYGYGSYSTIRNAWTGTKAVITAVEGVTGTSLQIFWNPVSGAETYDIYRSEAADGAYTKISSAKGTDVSYTDKNLNMTGEYYYKIEVHMKGYKATGTSGMGAAVSGHPVQQTAITSVAENGTGSLRITWNMVKDITGYQIYRSTEQNGTYSLIHTIDNYNINSYDDVAAEPGVRYYYKVVLVNTYNGSAVYGGYSDVVSGMLQPAPQTP